MLFIPQFGIELCGLPEANTYSYGSILGAVLLGIGIALLIDPFAMPLSGYVILWAVVSLISLVVVYSIKETAGSELEGSPAAAKLVSQPS